VIGDWLIGPTRRLRALTEGSKPFSLKDSQRMYDDLISELGEFNGAVAIACEAKHYGLINWGAAIFEFFPFYPDETKILDSVFLNNYGNRTIHEDSGFVSFNWAAPTGIALNTINVNNKMCSCLGTSVHSQDECDAIRDEVERLLMEIADSPEPVELV